MNRADKRPALPGPRFGTVVFDCDSTLSTIEGIDELAGAHRAEVAALTDAAMRGEIALEAVYGRRLALIRPARAEVDALADRYLATIVEGARETIAALREIGIDVRIISGGLRPAILPLARELGVEPARVAAVDLHFGREGEYLGFDEASPLARAGGKRDVLASWRPAMPSPVMLVGDGATDLEARPAVDAFVAYAGVVARPPVIAAADLTVRSRSLVPIFAIAAGDARPPGALGGLHDAGLRLLGRMPDESPTFNS